MAEQELKVHQKQPIPHKEETTRAEKYYVPAVNIYETEKDVTVIAEMPGVTLKGVEVSLEDDLLTIKGDMEREPMEKYRTLLQEYESGNYLRRFTVAETIDQKNISASMADGILTITLPKMAPAQPRKIEITAG